MGKAWDVVQGLKPTMMMIAVQTAVAGVGIFYKLASNAGLSLPILVAYRFMFAAATVIPLALLFERKGRPRMTWKVVLLAFVCALFGGTMAQNLLAKSLTLTSATFAMAMTNIVPAMTFILAVLFRMEGLALKTWAGRGKVIGTCMCIGGAMLLTFCKGLQIKTWSTHLDLLHRTGQHHTRPQHHNNILGFFLALGSCFTASISLIFQAKMGRIYPCHYSSTALISLIGVVQATGFAMCLERDWSEWRLGWNVKLLAAAFMGIVSSGVMWAFTMCCVRMRGPVFVSVFNPLALVLVAVCGPLFLNEKLYLGSVVGSVVIIVGLYTVLWGKNKEMKKMNQLVALDSVDQAQGDGGETLKGFNQSSTANAIIAIAPPDFVTSSEIILLDDHDIETQSQTDCHPQQQQQQGT